MTFLATITYGATIVPILHDFTPADAVNIINHSDAVLLFASDSLMEQIDFNEIPEIRAVVSLDSRKVVAERGFVKMGRYVRDHAVIVKNLSRHFRKRYPNGFKPSDIHYKDVDGNAVAVLNYTSGTTGFSKGVMLTYENLRGNVVFGIRSRLHYQGSRALSFLPLAHAYGLSLIHI